MGLEKTYLLPYGVFKIMEFFCFLVTWTTVTDQFSNDEYNVSHSQTKSALLAAVCVIGWLFSLLWFALYFTGVCVQIKVPRKNLLNAALHLVLGILVLVAASFITDVFAKHNSFHTFKSSAVFGLSAGILLILDSILHVVKGEPDKG